MKRLPFNVAVLAAMAGLYAWQPSHDFILSRRFVGVILYGGFPVVFLLWAYGLVAGRGQVTPWEAVKYLSLFSLTWIGVYCAYERAWTLDAALHSWVVGALEVYYPLLLVALTIAAWRRRHPATSRALQRQEPSYAAAAPGYRSGPVYDAELIDDNGYLEAGQGGALASLDGQAVYVPNGRGQWQRIEGGRLFMDRRTREVVQIVNGRRRYYRETVIRQGGEE